MRPCLRARPRADIFMYLVPIFAVFFKSLYELLVLFLGPPPILLGLIKGFLILAARLI
jgi:hypothetical protein